MGFVASLLTVKIHPAITAISLVVVSRSIFSIRSSTLKSNPFHDQISIYAKIIVAEQVRLPRLVDQCIEKLSRRVRFHQALAFLAKQLRIETLFLYLHVKNQLNNSL